MHRKLGMNLCLNVCFNRQAVHKMCKEMMRGLAPKVIYQKTQ